MTYVTDKVGLTGKGGWGDQLTRSLDPRAPARAQERAQEAAMSGLGQQLDYLKEREQLPIEIRDQALGSLRDYFLGGNQQGFIDQVLQSPVYQNMLGQGEQAVMRNAAATGGLRSGNAQQALAANSQNVFSNLLNQQLSGIGSLAQTPLNTNAISNVMGQMGQQMGQGYLDAYGAQQQGLGNLVNLGMAGYQMFSDIRLKENIEYLSDDEKGNAWYKWDWNDEAKEIGLKGSGIGVMAHEQDLDKLSVDTATGYLMVDYSKVIH